MAPVVFLVMQIVSAIERNRLDEIDALRFFCLAYGVVLADSEVKEVKRPLYVLPLLDQAQKHGANVIIAVVGEERPGFNI